MKKIILVPGARMEMEKGKRKVLFYCLQIKRVSECTYLINLPIIIINFNILFIILLIIITLHPTQIKITASGEVFGERNRVSARDDLVRQVMT